jgi:hypothetical protein
MTSDPARVGHRAQYTLECGTWRATCRVCGWQATNPIRRQAATQFRFHIQATSAQDVARTDESVTDVRSSAPDTLRLEVAYEAAT